jgi:hypothetical protein
MYYTRPVADSELLALNFLNSEYSTIVLNQGTRYHVLVLPVVDDGLFCAFFARCTPVPCTGIRTAICMMR